MYFLTPCVVEELLQSTCNATALYAFWPLARVCVCLVEHLLTTCDLIRYA